MSNFITVKDMSGEDVTLDFNRVESICAIKMHSKDSSPKYQVTMYTGDYILITDEKELLKLEAKLGIRNV